MRRRHYARITEGISGYYIHCGPCQWHSGRYATRRGASDRADVHNGRFHPREVVR